MLLQILYMLAFVILAVLAIGNLMRNMFTLGVESQRYSTQRNRTPQRNADGLLVTPNGAIAHPELLDEMGNLTTEPLMVMKSISVEDARDQLDALYKASPNYDTDASEG